jgi:hypothetical protein
MDGYKAIGGKSQNLSKLPTGRSHYFPHSMDQCQDTQAKPTTTFLLGWGEDRSPIEYLLKTQSTPEIMKIMHARK